MPILSRNSRILDPLHGSMGTVSVGQPVRELRAQKHVGLRELCRMAELSGKAEQWVPTADPIHFDKPEMVGVGPGQTFGIVVAQAERDRPYRPDALRYGRDQHR